MPTDRQNAGHQAAAKPLILMPDAEFEGPPDLEEAIFGDSLRLAVHRAHKADEIPASLWRDCAGILAWHNVTIAGALVEQLKTCRIIVRVGAGYDNMALEACGRRGIAVCNVPDYGVNEVSDHAIALMLSLGRGIGRYHDAVVADPVGGWVVDKTPAIRRFAGLTFGVVGMGRIGTAAARRAAAFGLRILFFDPYLPTGAELGLGFARADSLTALLEQSDIVSLHTPLTDETRNMIDGPALARMRPDAVLINTARGPIIDLDALAEALRAGRLAAAGLDVLPQEPPVAETALVGAVHRREPWTVGRVIITPHAAWYSRDSYGDLRRKAALVARDFLRDGRLRDCVNRQFLATGIN